MSTFDISSFDFSALSEVSNPFEQKKDFQTDDRYYVVPKDDKGNGVAVIAFLPDNEKNIFKKVQKINTTIIKNGKKRFLNTLSPYTIGKPCPFNETAVRLWNEGDKDGYKIFQPSKRYICNIKVLKDPNKPENEGKIFLYDMSQKLLDKIQSAVSPSAEDLALGETRKEVFNPLRGWVFKLVAKKSTGITSYDTSEFIRCEKIGINGSIYGPVDTAEEIQKAGQKAVQEIKEKTYNLNDLVKPEVFMSYDELYSKLQFLAGGMYGIPDNSQKSNTEKPETTEKPEEVLIETSSDVKVEKEEKKPTTEEDEIDALIFNI